MNHTLHRIYLIYCYCNPTIKRGLSMLALNPKDEKLLNELVEKYKGYRKPTEIGRAHV